MSLSRRSFLRGAAGVTLGLPLLEMLQPRRAWAQNAEPTRVLIISTGFSMDINTSYERETWSSSGDDSDIGTLSTILQPLEAHRDRLTIVGGIDNVVAGLMASNGHNASGKTLLACYPIKAAFDSSGNFTEGVECDWTSEVAGPSIDHHLASRLGTPLLPLSIGGVHAEHRMRWQQVGDSVVFDEGETNPQQVFDNLFTTTDTPPAEPSPLEILRARRGSVLDAVLDQLGSVRRRAGQADRQRLDQHADLVRAIERDVQQTVQIVCDNPSLSLPTNWSSVEADLFNGDGVHDDVLLRTMGRLSALAFSCQATRVASIHMRTIQTNTFPWLAGGSPFIPANFHAVVHHDEGTAQQRETIYRWYATAIGELLDTLAATPDGPDTSLLDNTLVVWVSSLRHSSHSTSDLPVLLVGDLQGTLRSGRRVDYQPGGSRSLGDLWTTLLQAMGAPDTHFGWNTGSGAGGRPLNSGPLTELFA